MIIQGIEIYYAAACLILVCSSVFCAFVRYFHMCRPFDENESYFYPARKLITFIFACFALPVVWLFRMDSADAWIFMRSFLILFLPGAAVLSFRRYFFIELKHRKLLFILSGFLPLSFILILWLFAWMDCDILHRHQKTVLWLTGIYSLFITGELFILYLLTRLVGGKLEKKKVLIACVMGILSMHIWQFFYDDSYTDYRLLLLFSFVFYSVTIALCLSHLGFRSDHFFLSVSGSIKPMDIALYKWFRTAPNGIVTIGRSVDCNLQINWDINGKISPVHAEIRMQKGRLRLYALEEGVFVNGKSCPLNKGLRLYHGMSFRIGNTDFVYKENLIL